MDSIWLPVNKTMVLVEMVTETVDRQMIDFQIVSPKPFSRDMIAQMVISSHGRARRPPAPFLGVIIDE